MTVPVSTLDTATWNKYCTHPYKDFFKNLQKYQVYNFYCTHEKAEVVGQPTSLKSERRVLTGRDGKWTPTDLRQAQLLASENSAGMLHRPVEMAEESVKGEFALL